MYGALPCMTWHGMFRSAYVTWPTSHNCTRALDSLQVMGHVQL
jgi:hypothetical protein